MVEIKDNLGVLSLEIGINREVGAGRKVVRKNNNKKVNLVLEY